MPRKPKIIKIEDSFENVAKSVILGIDKKKKKKTKSTGTLTNFNETPGIK